MIGYRGYACNIISAKASEGPPGSTVSVRERNGDAMEMIHMEARQFSSDSDAEAAARHRIERRSS